MPEVISSISEASPRGVFIIFKAVLDAVKAVGTGRAAMVAKFPWGPINSEEEFGDAATFRSVFAPDGFTRNGQGYLMATKFPWVDLRIVRILGVSPVKATFNIQTGGAVNVLRVDGKYFGVEGNGISVTIANATDGTGTSFDMTISKTDSLTGLVTSETYQNVDSTKVPDDANNTYWAGVTAKSLLVGPLVKLTSGRPANTTISLASGSDGAALVSGDYLGTPGSADKGVAVLEKDDDISFVFTDDPGAPILAAVMAGLKAHVLLKKDRRVAIVMGNALESKATAITNVALNRDTHVVYVWPHGTVRDDQGNTVTIPLSGPLASLATILTPHLSVAYKSAAFTKALANITELDVVATKQTKIDLDKVGVVVFQKNPRSGHFAPYNDTTTTIGIPLFATRMADYIAFSIASALEEFDGAPNDTETQEDERSLAEGFLQELKNNQKIDHIFRPCILDFQVFPIEASNTQAQIDAGDFTIDFKAKLISEQKRCFLRGQIGTTVTVTPVAG